MQDPDDSLKHNPFNSLKAILKDKPLPGPARRIVPSKPDPPIEKESEERAFQEAMKDVRPIVNDKYVKGKAAAGPPESFINETEKDVMAQLENLVNSGEGFIISNTPEYMEGTGHDIPPELAERLHRGDFSIQGHIDLHGMGVAEAKDAFETFLREAVSSGKRAVLVIHGRGLSSPGEPVLKNKVSEWLTRGHWRKWIIAYTSAQSHDGGTGATYILLRHRPVSKRFRKKSRRL
ncbi:MAG: Smr/MutS family protein [Deltaproteobacteria bacterium]|nr:Smr/MutS family protein [Deltaproteobacteria bacterium]